MEISLYPETYRIVVYSVAKENKRMSDIFVTSPEKKDRPVAGRRAAQSASPAEHSDIPAGAAATGEFQCAIYCCMG